MIRELITDEKNKKTRERKSIFLLTINTNKTFNTRNQEALDRMPQIKSKLISLLEELLTKQNLLKLIIDIGPIGTKERKIINPDKIKDIKVNSQIEANYSKSGFLHSHSVIEIIHNTRILLDLNLIKKVSYKYLEKVLTFNGKFKKPYINIQAKTSQDFSIEHYVKEGTEIQKII